MAAYYNEHDRKAAATLRELIKKGHIASGDVDERDIRDVRPDELRPYTQVHLYAGCGTWSYAARLAGWPDDNPMWTFSEPCQPFSSAGKGLGSADERYLRWATHHLVTECRPEVCFAEQVASSDGLAWLDTVQADMEGENYTVRAFDLCAAGFGAPHIRQRLYIVAYSLGEQDNSTDQGGFYPKSSGNSLTGRMAESECAGLERHSRNGNRSHEPRRKFPGQNRSASPEGATCGMGNAANKRASGHGKSGESDGEPPRGGRPGNASNDDASSPTNGHWRDADWLFCRDGKWRPVEPGTFPLAHGASERVGRLRMYGNGIVASQAAEFIKASWECIA